MNIKKGKRDTFQQFRDLITTGNNVPATISEIVPEFIVEKMLPSGADSETIFFAPYPGYYWLKK